MDGCEEERRGEDSEGWGAVREEESEKGLGR